MIETAFTTFKLANLQSESLVRGGGNYDNLRDRTCKEIRESWNWFPSPSLGRVLPPRFLRCRTSLLRLIMRKLRTEWSSGVDIFFISLGVSFCVFFLCEKSRKAKEILERIMFLKSCKLDHTRVVQKVFRIVSAGLSCRLRFFRHWNMKTNSVSLFAWGWCDTPETKSGVNLQLRVMFQRFPHRKSCSLRGVIRRYR